MITRYNIVGKLTDISGQALADKKLTLAPAPPFVLINGEFVVGSLFVFSDMDGNFRFQNIAANRTQRTHDSYRLEVFDDRTRLASMRFRLAEKDPVPETAVDISLFIPTQI